MKGETRTSTGVVGQHNRNSSVQYCMYMYRVRSNTRRTGPSTGAQSFLKLWLERLRGAVDKWKNWQILKNWSCDRLTDCSRWFETKLHPFTHSPIHPFTHALIQPSHHVPSSHLSYHLNTSDSTWSLTVLVACDQSVIQNPHLFTSSPAVILVDADLLTIQANGFDIETDHSCI